MPDGMEGMWERNQKWLWKKEDKLEQARLESAKRDLEHLQFTPNITERAKRTPVRRGQKFPERFDSQEEDRRRRLENRREEIERDERSCTFKPKLSRRAMSTPRRKMWKDVAQMTSDHQDKVDRLRREKVREELSQMRAHPNTNERSQRIMFRRQEREKGASGHPEGPSLEFADLMLEKHRIARLQLHDKLAAEEAEKCPRTPQITTFAASLQREGEVGDRLYEMFLERLERDHYQQKETEMGGFHHFHPVTNSNSHIKRDLPIEEELLTRHEYAKSAKEEQIQRMHEEERASHHPAINPVSRVIVAARGERPPIWSARGRNRSRDDESRSMRESSQGRYQGRSSGGYNSHTTASHNSDDMMVEDFYDEDQSDGGSSGHWGTMRDQEEEPKLIGGGRVSHQHALDHINNMNIKEQQRQERLEQLRMEADQNLETELMPAPIIARSNAERIEDSQRHGGGGHDFYDRAADWARRRDDRLREERERKESEARQECTFMPVVHRVPDGQLGSEPDWGLIHSEQGDYPGLSPNNPAGGGHSTPRGGPLSSRGGGEPAPIASFDEFVLRQQEARERRRETGTVFATGKNWSNKLTQPKPFKLGRSGSNPSIKSLQRPMTAGLAAEYVRP